MVLYGKEYSISFGTSHGGLAAHHDGRSGKGCDGAARKDLGTEDKQQSVKYGSINAMSSESGERGFANSHLKSVLDIECANNGKSWTEAHAIDSDCVSRHNRCNYCGQAGFCSIYDSLSTFSSTFLYLCIHMTTLDVHSGNANPRLVWTSTPCPW